MADSGVDADWSLVHGSAAAALQAGDFERAIHLYSGFLERWPDYDEAYYKRAVALNGLGRLELALADYDRAIDLNPGHGNAFCNRGFVLEKLHRLEEAMRSYDRASAINPDDYLVPYNRASILKRLGRLSDALLSYEQAIKLKADFAEALVNRGNVLQQMGRHEEAVASYHSAIASNPRFAAAFQGLGTSLLILKHFEDAIRAFNEALRLNPGQPYILGLRRNAQMQICEWSGWTGDIDLIVRGVELGNAICPPYAMLALVDSPPLHRLTAEIWVRHEFPANDSLGAIAVRRKSQKIRIGYFSADFRSHAVALLTAELFEIHDRGKFEIMGFGFGPDSKDTIRGRLERAFDSFLDVRTQSDIEIASLARRMGIDIAVDLGGFTEHSRTGIFALRAAPIQMSYIGYLGTMGAPYMDYLVADAAIIPDAEQSHYAEKIVYLRSYQANDSKRTTTRVFTREDLGLPPRGFVFSCFNANYKILPATFAVWMRILKRVANSCLYVYSENDLIDRNLRKEAVKLGVDPDRIIFGRRMGLEDYLARFRAMDLFLDTLPYNAGTTASDALWAGLPVLTCTGRSFAGRVATSLLRAIDLPELITSSPEQYENLAVQLAEKPGSLAGIKAKLERNRAITPLFDTRLFAANLERAYIEIMKRFEAGLPPDHIRVDA